MSRLMGSPKTGGRKPGVPNRKTQSLIETSERLGVDPFEILLNLAAGRSEALGYGPDYSFDPKLRLDAASEACEYMYPKRRALDQNIHLDANDKEILEQVEYCRSLPRTELLELAKRKIDSLAKDV